MNKKVLIMVSALASLGIGAMAIWISGFSLTGAFISTSGSKPEVELATWDVSLTGAPQNQLFTYTNGDGVKTVDLAYSDTISSMDGACIYEPAKDFKVYSTTWSGGQATICEINATETCPYGLVHGANTINISFVPNPNTCPLTGTYSIGFSI